MTEKTNIGKVLWFDQRKGWGFVKIVNPESEFLNKEVFVHYSSIQCDNSFKKLFPGEVLSLNISQNTDEGKIKNGREFVSSNVTGVFGTNLLIDNPDYNFKVIKKRDNVDNSA